MKSSGIPAILIWVLYGLAAGCALFLAAMTICVDHGFNAEMGLLAGAVILAVLGGICFGISRKTKYARQEHSDSRKMAALAIESMLVVALLVLMVAVRVIAFGKGVVWDIAGQPAYMLAQVEAVESIPAIAHGGQDLYVRMLRLCMVFLGNKPEAVVVLQLVLLVPAALSLYLGIRKSVGALAAVLATAVLGFSPYLMRETCKPSAFLLVLLLYSMAIRAISGLPELAVGKKLWAVLYFIGMGSLVGICCYLDMAGISLLILLTGVICFCPEGDNSLFGWQVLAFLVGVSAAAGGYFICHAIRGLKGLPLSVSMVRQLELYLPQRFILPIGAGGGANAGDVMLVAVFMAVGIFSFWVSRRIRVKGIWLFVAALLFFMQCLQMGDLDTFNTYGILYLIGVVMGADSIQDLFLPQMAAAGEGVKDMQETNAGGKENSTQSLVPNAGEGAAAGQEKLEKVDLNSDAVAAQGVQYIENPLPLPKKKPHKVMDYDYEVSDYDDFDIP